MSDSLRILSKYDINDSQKWQSEIAHNRFSHVFHSHGWAKTFAESYGHIPNLYAFISSNAEFLLPISVVKRPFVTNLQVSMPYSDFAGPVSQTLLDYDTIKQIPLLLDFDSIDLRLDRPILDKSLTSSYSSYRTNLPSTSEEFWESLPSKSVKYSIRKALRDGYSIEEAGLNEITVFYSLMGLTRKKHGLPTPPLKFYINLYKNLISSGNGFILLAKDSNGTVIAGSLFLFHGQFAYYKYNASDSGFREASLRSVFSLTWVDLTI
jgi:hypothetical protein